MSAQPKAKEGFRTRESDPSLDRRKRATSELYEDPLQFLWAVSYADLLMVLMCFFVIYFEMSDVPLNPLNQIIVAISNTAGGVAGGGPGEPTKREPLQEVAENVNLAVEGISRALGSSNVKVERDRITGSILVNFPDDFFSAGQYEINSRGRESIKILLDRLKPFSKNIEMTFVGHADATPIHHLRSRKIIDSNLVLSTLRATKAVEFAINEGFESRWISSQGVGEHTRNTRSLGLRIMARPQIESKTEL